MIADATNNRCSWCGHGDRLDRGNVIPFAEIAPGHVMTGKFGYTGLHLGCSCAEDASKAFRLPPRKRRVTCDECLTDSCEWRDRDGD